MQRKFSEVITKEKRNEVQAVENMEKGKKGFMERAALAVKKIKQKVVLVAYVIAAAYLSLPMYAYASADSYLAPINKLKTALLGIVAAVGGVVIVFGGVKFAEAFQKKDQNGEYQAIYTLLAGFIMAGISGLVAVLS
jgi:FtsH-binding integral membrane protein